MALFQGYVSRLRAFSLACKEQFTGTGSWGSLIAITILACAILLTTGCLSIKGPAAPKVFVINKQTDKDLLTEVKNYREGACMHVPSGASCRVDRDTIVYDLKRTIDLNYQAYALQFEQTQDTALLLGETTGTSLTAVATLVGASDLKDILTTASTLAQATSTSVQKNYYQKQTGYTILNVMDGDRAKKWSSIYDLLVKNDAEKYSLSEALGDLLEYRAAGTAVHALTSIQQSAAATKVDATAKIQNTDVKNGRATTPP